MREQKISWGEAMAVYAQRPVMGMIFLGFSAGLPFLLVFSTLTAWLTDAGVTRSAIGFFAWVGMTYSIKVLWAPVIDRVALPVIGGLLGQRRSWIVLGQGGIMLGLLILAKLDPALQLQWVACSALLIAFSSATQDVAIDAFRIESAEDELQGAMSAAYIFGYRVALLVAGAGALYLADAYNWSLSYSLMALCMLPGVLVVLCLPEPQQNTASVSGSDAGQRHRQSDAELIREQLGAELADKTRQQALRQWLLAAVVCPFVDFFRRNGSLALVILALIALFRLSDLVMGIMANPFYLDLGYSKTEIASIAKFFGFFMTILGSALCGVLVVKWGIFKPLLLGAIMVAATNVLFALLAYINVPDIRWLALVISADNLSAGIASTAFVAYLSSLTNRAYTATQYALFSSLMTLPGKFISGFSGLVVDGQGYVTFFMIAALLGLPAIGLVLFIKSHLIKSAGPSE